MQTLLLHLTLLSLRLLHAVAAPCATTCGSTAVNYPFSLADGCGAAAFRHMLNCSASTDLFLQTPSAAYKVQSIDYASQTLTLYDPAMSTCSILQPRRDLLLSAALPPSSDTVFALLNCSADSPVLNRYSRRCFNFSGHHCADLYAACNAFRVFRGGAADNGTAAPPPCCFTDYSTVRYMGMNILDCSHYTSFYNSDELEGVGPLDWDYGMKMTYSLPETGCDRCRSSGGACGFDTETEGMVCLCSSTLNSTRECAAGTVVGEGSINDIKETYFYAILLIFGVFLLFT